MYEKYIIFHAVSSKFCIPERSAHGKRIKRDSAINEGVRRLRNCSIEMGWGEKAKILSEWSSTLKKSGYQVGFRMDVIKAACDIYDSILQKDVDQERPVYRSNKYIKDNGNVTS